MSKKNCVKMTKQGVEFEVARSEAEDAALRAVTPFHLVRLPFRPPLARLCPCLCTSATPGSRLLLLRIEGFEGARPIPAHAFHLAQSCSCGDGRRCSRSPIRRLIYLSKTKRFDHPLAGVQSLVFPFPVSDPQRTPIGPRVLFCSNLRPSR